MTVLQQKQVVPYTNSKKKCPYWLVVWPICLNFMLCFLLVPLYASTRTPLKGTCAKPFIIISQYSTGPQHNMGCKYMLDVLGWTPLSQRRQEAQLILFYKIIYGFAQVPLEGVLVEAYKGTRRKHSMKFRQIGHTTSQSFSLRLLVHGTGLLSLKLRHWLYLDQIFLTVSVHPFRIIP